jgi:hypothetical protein
MAQFDAVKNLRPRSKITVKVTGMLTGQEWAGEFEFYRVLTHRQQLEKDRTRREFLGAFSEAVDPNTFGRANAFADLKVRVISAPSWWENSNGGLDLIDDEVLLAVFEAVLKNENEFVAERMKKVADAKKDLAGMSVPDADPIR